MHPTGPCLFGAALMKYVEEHNPNQEMVRIRIDYFKNNQNKEGFVESEDGETYVRHNAKAVVRLNIGPVGTTTTTYLRKVNITAKMLHHCFSIKMQIRQRAMALGYLKLSPVYLVTPLAQYP